MDDDIAACGLVFDLFHLAEGADGPIPYPKTESERAGIVADLRDRASRWKEKRGAIASAPIRAAGDALADCSAERAALLEAPVPPRERPSPSAQKPTPAPAGNRPSAKATAAAEREAALREAAEYGIRPLLAPDDYPAVADASALEKNRQSADEAGGAWFHTCARSFFAWKAKGR
jgi:hypothetical protein